MSRGTTARRCGWWSRWRRAIPGRRRRTARARVVRCGPWASGAGSRTVRRHSEGRPGSARRGGDRRSAGAAAGPEGVDADRLARHQPGVERHEHAGQRRGAGVAPGPGDRHCRAARPDGDPGAHRRWPRWRPFAHADPLRGRPQCAACSWRERCRLRCSGPAAASVAAPPSNATISAVRGRPRWNVAGRSGNWWKALRATDERIGSASRGIGASVPILLVGPCSISNRYRLSAGATASTTALTLGFIRTVRHAAPTLTLQYGVDKEHVRETTRTTAFDGRVFAPIPLVSREVHLAGVVTRFPVRRLWDVEASAGYTVDRFGGRGSFLTARATPDAGQPRRSRLLGRTPPLFAGHDTTGAARRRASDGAVLTMAVKPPKWSPLVETGLFVGLTLVADAVWGPAIASCTSSRIPSGRSCCSWRCSTARAKRSWRPRVSSIALLAGNLPAQAFDQSVHEYAVQVLRMAALLDDGRRGARRAACAAPPAPARHRRAAEPRRTAGRRCCRTRTRRSDHREGTARDPARRPVADGHRHVPGGARARDARSRHRSWPAPPIS